MLSVAILVALHLCVSSAIESEDVDLDHCLQKCGLQPESPPRKDTTTYPSERTDGAYVRQAFERSMNYRETKKKPGLPWLATVSQRTDGAGCSGVVIHRNYVVVNAECIIQEVPRLIRFAPTRAEPLFDGGIKFYSGADRLNARARNQSRVVDRIIFPQSVHALFFANNGTLRVKAAIAVVQLKQGFDFNGNVWNVCLPASIDKMVTRVASMEQLERGGYGGEAITAYRTSDNVWYAIGMSFSYTETVWHDLHDFPEYKKHTTLNWLNQSTGTCKFISEATRSEVRCDDDVDDLGCTAIVNEYLKAARGTTTTLPYVQPQLRRW